MAPLMGQDKMNVMTIKHKIDSLFVDFENEKFIQDTGLVAQAGWMMTLPLGGEVSRSFLMTQADTIISFGKDAVPFLFQWVMSDVLAVRYIAIYSLQQITGLKPAIPIFDKEDAARNREKAIAEWKAWWENQQKN